ncbi:hypothetical protein V7O66_13900 [Methanolobus sp. ZRKC3]
MQCPFFDACRHADEQNEHCNGVMKACAIRQIHYVVTRVPSDGEGDQDAR